MSSSSNDPESPESSRWVHEEPTSIGERPPRTPAPPAPSDADTKLEPRKVRGVFGKPSLPPPPAGRGPVNFPGAASPRLPTPPGTGAPELPTGLAALDDPLAGLFDSGPHTVVIEDGQEAPPTLEPERASERDDPTLVPRGDESFASLLSQPPEASSQVAKLELAKTMLAFPAEEVMAPEPSRDPRSEDSVRPNVEPNRSSLLDVVFDPDQSVARRLGEVAIDGDVGPASESEALRDLPLPQVPAAPSPSIDQGPMDTVPVRSTRAAFVIIALVLISGGAATLVSLGVLGGSPTDFRPKTPITPNPGPALTPVSKPASAINAASADVSPEPAPTQAGEKPRSAVAAATPVAREPEAAREPETKPVAPVEATATAVPPTSADPIEQGDALRRADDLDAAIEKYQAALAADPRDHHAMEGLVRVYLARGDAKQAIVFAEQIVKRRAKRAAYRVLLGQARMSAGDRAGARQAFQEALALEPDNRDAQRLLGN